MRIADTHPEIRRRQLDVYRAMAPHTRVEVALRLSEEVKEIAIAGIRRRNPAMDEEAVTREWLRMLHGSRLAGVLAAPSPPR